MAVKLCVLSFATCLVVVKVEAMSTALFHESASASISARSWCVGRDDEDSSSILTAFLQVGLQVSNSTAKSDVVVKYGKVSTRVLDAHSRISRSESVTRPAVAFTQLRQLAFEQKNKTLIDQSRQASTTSSGLGILVVGVAVLVLLGILVTCATQAGEVGERPVSPLGFFHGQFARSPSACALLAERNRAAAAISGIVPICEQLILPKTEARFLINMNDLHRLTEGSTFNIKGTSGRTLLTAILVVEEASRKLRVSSVGLEDKPRATLTANLDEGNLVLCGQSEEAYGTIEPIPNSPGSVLKHKGVPVMNIEKVERVDLEMRAVSLSSKRELARSSRKVTGDVSQWKLNVKAGVDAVLIVSCMLGIMLLKDGVNRRVVVMCDHFVDKDGRGSFVKCTDSASNHVATLPVPTGHGPYGPWLRKELVNILQGDLQLVKRDGETF